MTCYALMFHHFHTLGQLFGQGSITSETFEEILNYIGRDNILPAQEWMDKAIRGTLGENDTCITFDDNLKCQYDVARPVLDQYGLTAFFFIYSSVCQGNVENLEVYRVFRTEHFENVNAFYHSFEPAAVESFTKAETESLSAFRHEHYIQQFSYYTPGDRRFRFIRDELLGPERYYSIMDKMIAQRGLTKEHLAHDIWMDNANLKALSDKGHIIGLHSYSHPTRLEQFPFDEQRQEYQRNFDHIAAITGVIPISMSHPCNSYSADTLSILRDMGIQIGFCSNMGEVTGRSLLEIRRLDHADILKRMAA